MKAVAACSYVFFLYEHSFGTGLRPLLGMLQNWQGEAWIALFIKLLYQKTYLGENNATHPMALTVDGQVGWCSSCNEGLAVQRPAFLVGEVPRLLQFVLFSRKKKRKKKKSKAHQFFNF